MNGIQYYHFHQQAPHVFLPAKLQSLTAGPACPQPIHDALRTQSPIPLAKSTPWPQSLGANDVEVLATAKAKKTHVKSADWTEEETNELLEAWAPKFSKLRGASQREKIKIWNEIYSLYKERCPESQRTLQQVKKRQQNLDNEYKQLKQRTLSTGEAGIKKIKEGFPYFDIFDDVMGQRDSIDPSKMAIEGSSTFTSEPSTSAVNDASQNESVNVSLDETETPNDVTEVQKSGEKRKAEKDKQEKSGRKGKRRRRDQVPESTQDWQSSFMEMWEKSMEQDNARFERSAEMFRDAQSRQMEQTNAILAGFKDIFKDLVSK